MSRELGDPKVWDTPEKAQELGRERAKLDDIVGVLDKLGQALDDCAELLDMAVEAEDHSSVNAITHDLRKLEADVAKLEFRRMFSGEMDSANAFIEVTAGAGGTDE